VPSLVAGVDCSTQSTKVVLVDPASGAIVGQGQAPHVVTGESGARETDPESWWVALTAALAATGRAHEVAAISVAGQQHGLVVL
jgi:xylulokinase